MPRFVCFRKAAELPSVGIAALGWFQHGGALGAAWTFVKVALIPWAIFTWLIGYSALLGLMMGAFTHAATAQSGNIALIAQAIIGTFAGAIGVLAVYATPFGRKASKGGKLFVGVMIGYAIIGLANVAAVVFMWMGPETRGRRFDAADDAPVH